MLFYSKGDLMSIEIEIKQRCKKYRELTKSSLKEIKISVQKTGSFYEIVKDFISMTENYLSDGEYYEKQQKYDIALASYSYAHAWLDALARMGLIDTNNNYKKFTLYK